MMRNYRRTLLRQTTADRKERNQREEKIGMNEEKESGREAERDGRGREFNLITCLNLIIKVP